MMKKLLKIFTVVFVAFIALCLYAAKDVKPGQPVAVAAASTPTEPVGKAAVASKSMAIVIAQSKVKAQLKSPSTADFEYLNGEAIDKGDGHFLVRDHVDSQNGFGATVRSEYIVDMQYTGGDEADESNWTMKNLTLK